MPGPTCKQKMVCVCSKTNCEWRKATDRTVGTMLILDASLFHNIVRICVTPSSRSAADQAPVLPVGVVPFFRCQKAAMTKRMMYRP